MKILITGAPLAGHLNPLLAVGRFLAQEGHEVVVQTATVFRPSVEACGLTFHPFHPAADIDMRDMDAFFPERKNSPPGPASRKLSWERLFIERMPHHDAGLRALLREFPAGVVIAENAFFGTLPILLGPR
jgi:UDP:flavonoid glycosyltransferase YjiC (YdhE family)